MYSSHQKAKVAHYARFHGARAAARKFKIHHRNAQHWLKEELDKKKLKKKPLRKFRKGQGRKISYPIDIEEELVAWILKKRDESNLAVSTNMIKIKALSLIKSTRPDFKASDGWLRKFLKRNDLVLRAKTSLAQSLPRDLENKIAEFRRNLLHIRENGDFQFDYIGNMDETPAYFDMVPSKTVDRKGKKSIKVRSTKSDKKRITVTLGCTATGKMLKPMIIFKGKTKRSINKVSEGNSIVAFQKKAWMDENIMKVWIKKIWRTYTKNNPSLLFLDSFSAHITPDIRSLFSECNTTVVVIPGGCTSILQPLDVSINKPFKVLLREFWESYMIEQSDRGVEEIKPPTKQHLVDWVLKGNQMLDSNVKKSFLVTGLSNALGGHEDALIRDDQVRQEIEEHLNEVFGENMGYVLPTEDTSDPFASSGEDSASDVEDSNACDEDSADSTSDEAESSNEDSSGSSILAPDYEPIDNFDSDPPSC